MKYEPTDAPICRPRALLDPVAKALLSITHRTSSATVCACTAFTANMEPSVAKITADGLFKLTHVAMEAQGSLDRFTFTTPSRTSANAASDF
jgi:hypothetical protein